MRGPRATWQAAGAKDTSVLARDLAAKWNRQTDGQLDRGRAEKLNECLARLVR